MFEWLNVPANWRNVSEIGTIIGLVLVFIQLWVLIRNHHRDYRRRRREATLTFLYTQGPEYSQLFREIDAYLPEDEIYDPAVLDDAQMVEIGFFLHKMEQLGVGFNMKTFDRKTLSRISGEYFGMAFDRLWPVIEWLRDQNDDPDRYVEFQSMVRVLRIDHRRRVKRLRYR